MRTRRNFLRGGNEGFVCAHCGTEVLPLSDGGYRNHCPVCLYSRHVDHVPGDRSETCGGPMKPIEVEIRARKGYVLVHRCTKCGIIRRNKAALSDPRQPDCFEKMLELCRSIGQEKGTTE